MSDGRVRPRRPTSGCALPKPLTSIAVLASTAFLAACGVPDAIAYGVKAVQHYNESPSRPAAGPVPQAVPAAAPTPVAVEAEPSAPPPVAMPPRRERIIVEELPPPR